MDQLLERIKQAYHFETDAQVANFLDIKPSTLSMQKNRGRLDLHRILKKCSDLNKNWLVDGIGPMRDFQGESSRQIAVYSSLKFNDHELDVEHSKKVGSLWVDLSLKCDTSKLIGYVVSESAEESPLQKNDIAIINLDDITVQKENIVMLTADHSVFFSRARGRSFGHNGTNPKVVGQMIWVVHRMN